MKTLIVAINAKYIHSSLAVWYLKAACAENCGEVKVEEFTINDRTDSILASIYAEKPDVVAFSCYIWNMGLVFKLSKTLKSLASELKIILGGPEVSFETDKLLEENPYVDFILSGEGEPSLPELISTLEEGSLPTSGIPGLSWRNGKEVCSDSLFVLVPDLDSLPSPYTQEMLGSLRNRIVYFEASRGCPFFCSYCISSTFEGVRFFSFERVKKELDLLVNSGADLVKFVDRTFNCNSRRAKEIFSYLIDKARGKIELGYVPTCFHFEMAADLFDEEMFSILDMAPPGLFQFEIGIQSTNPATLEAVDRKTSVDKVISNVRRLRKKENIHLHLDLIAGLPLEDYLTFQKSFNQVYSMQPHQLQLGFLKMLRGSKIRVQAQKYGYVFRDFPPYEILKNQFISFDELLELKGVEELLGRYYNSTRFEYSLEYALKSLSMLPFDFYREFYFYNREKGYLERPLSSRELYVVLLEYLKKIFSSEMSTIQTENQMRINELLKYDYLASDCSGNFPTGVKRSLPENFKEACFEFLKDEKNILEYIPGFSGLPAKEIFKKVHFETFDCEIPSGDLQRSIILFDYSRKHSVTGKYESFSLSLD